MINNIARFSHIKWKYYLYAYIYSIHFKMFLTVSTFIEQMNDSTENSLHQFERIEKEVTTGNTSRLRQEQNPPPPSLNQQMTRSNNSVLAELQQLQQQRLQMMLEDEEDDERDKQGRTTQRSNIPSSSGERVGSNEPAETDETEKISASSILSPASNILNTSSITPNNNQGGAQDPLLKTANAFGHYRVSSRTPSSSLFGPLKIPNFKQADLLPPPQLPSKQKQPLRGAAMATSDENRPMFHSTPQQQQQANGAMFGGRGGGRNTKRSHNLYTPGGRPVSPIAEERNEDDLDRLVSEVGKLHGEQGGDKVIQSLVKQLRDLIVQWDWAQARHRHVSKIYFERQQQELNSGWEMLQTEMAKFNQQKTEEWTKIAGIRSGLQSDKAKASAKKDAERIKEMELEIGKQKAKELLSSQKMSELRTKVHELEGEVRVREKSYSEHMIKLRKLEQQLVRAEQENSNLRTKLTLIRAEKQQQQQTAPAQQNGNQQQKPGPRATLFNIYHNQNTAGGGRISSTSSSMGAGSSSTTVPVAPFSAVNPLIRRNNSDSTFIPTEHQQQQLGDGRMHRCNSENGTNGIQQPLRPRVRFADIHSQEQQHAQQNQVDQQFALAAFAAASPPGNGAEMGLLNKRFDIPAGMMNTMYQMTKRGREFTFSDGQKRVLVAELLGCQLPPFCRQCTFYEYPLAGVAGGKNFRWTSSPLIIQGKQQKIQIEYLHEERLYEVRTSLGNIIRFLLTGQVELCWTSGDRTLIMPDGERREIFNATQPDFSMEIYMPTGIAYRLDASTQWQREQFVPDTERMAIRPDGSYSTVIVQALRENDQTTNKAINQSRQQQQEMTPDDLVSLQINGPDFKLRRFNGTRAVKVAMDEPGIAGGSLQLWFCVDNVLLVKHIQKVNNRDNNGEGQKEKHICFAHGQCRHIRTEMSGGNGDNNWGIANIPMMTLD